MVELQSAAIYCLRINMQSWDVGWDKLVREDLQGEGHGQNWLVEGTQLQGRWKRMLDQNGTVRLIPHQVFFILLINLCILACL